MLQPLNALKCSVSEYIKDIVEMQKLTRTGTTMDASSSMQFLMTKTTTYGDS